MAPSRGIVSRRPQYRWNSAGGRWEVWDGAAWIPSALLKHLDGTQAHMVGPYGNVVPYDPNERMRGWP